MLKKLERKENTKVYALRIPTVLHNRILMLKARAQELDMEFTLNHELTTTLEKVCNQTEAELNLTIQQFMHKV